MSDNISFHDLMRNNTYMSQVEVDIPLHSVLVVGSYGIVLDLASSKFSSTSSLHLCIHFNLLMVHCTEALDYTVWGYIQAARYCIFDVQCYTATMQCCMEVVPG